MSIQMIGIDHDKASVEVRELFAFTLKKSAAAMTAVKEHPDVCGCVIISTCNRTELWVSVTDNFSDSLYDILCQIKKIGDQKYYQYFVERNEYEAVTHLLYLTCGLKSKILGEDQIITQVKDALKTSRENYCTDNVLEVLFRMAVTAAKKVKTEVALSQHNPSVIHYAIETLRYTGFDVKGRSCLVIGNGGMGRVAAQAIMSAGGVVTMTVRQYKSGLVDIPENCRRINYGERVEHFNEFDLIVSATASPNYTVKIKEIAAAGLDHPIVIIDLAVPRDVEPDVAGFPGINLYDIDYFQIGIENEQTKLNIKKAESILNEQLGEFKGWYECRDIIPKVHEISSSALTDLELRIQKTIASLPLSEEEGAVLHKTIEGAALKVVNKMMFGLRDTVDQHVFRECVEGLERFYGTEEQR